VSRIYLGVLIYSIPGVFLKFGLTADENFHQTLRQLLFGQRKYVVVSPVAIDVDVALLEPFVPKSQLLYDSQRRYVLRSDVDFDSVKAYLVHQIISH